VIKKVVGLMMFVLMSLGVMSNSAAQSEKSQNEKNCGYYCYTAENINYYHYAISPQSLWYPLTPPKEEFFIWPLGGRVPSEFELEIDDQFVRIFSKMDGSNYVAMDGNKLKIALQTSDGLVMRRTKEGSVGNLFSIKLSDGQVVGVISIVEDRGDRMGSVNQISNRVYITRAAPKPEVICDEIGIDGFATKISHHSQISIFPNNVISGGKMDLMRVGGENSFYICSDTPSGIFEVDMRVIDGVGGGTIAPLHLQINILSEYGELPSVRWE